MTKLRSILFLFLIFLATGCGLTERERAVARREAALAKKEQSLLLREKRLALRETEIRMQNDTLVQPADTLARDTVQFNPDILGKWYVVMVCTETNCAGSAVGDTKRETWEISRDGHLIVAKVLVSDKLTRVYTGYWIGNQLELSSITELNEAQPTKMQINLTPKDSKTMEGNRIITRGENCKTVFSLSLTKDSQATLKF